MDWKARVRIENGIVNSLKDPCVSVEELKQEAIKWVKKLEKGLDDENAGTVNSYCLDCERTIGHPHWYNEEEECEKAKHYILAHDWAESGDMQALVKFLKHFFNITEDDLRREEELK